MAEDNLRVLLADDDTLFLDDLTALMGKKYSVHRACSGAEALALIERFSFDAVLLDLVFGSGMSGLETLDRIRTLEPDLPVIMVTRDKTAASASAAFKRGAADYIDKTPNVGDLERRISRALEERNLLLENCLLRKEVVSLKGRMIGESAAMRALREEIRLAAHDRGPVLIVGETGTGKELVARAIHELRSPQGPYVPVNCAAVPRDLFERELFGSERGAYTGAEERHIGKVEIAGEGVLYLDEITEIDASLQAKFLRVIEEREFERLGGTQKIRFRGLILASSNRDLRRAIDEGSLRKDLYYRLSAHVIEVPPLRARKDDIPRLVEYFLERNAAELKTTRPDIGQETLEALCRHDWPGNVRELEHTIKAFLMRGRFALTPGGVAAAKSDGQEQDVLALPYVQARDAVLVAFQKKYIAAVLAASGGDVARAAERTGLTRFGLQKMMRRLGIDVGR